MSWVRYDDGFYSHPKVGAVIHDDPGALSLHVLANTWSCQQKRPGFVPTHQPAVLVGNKTRGAKWAALLERHGLWDRVDGGWEFHDHRDYRESSKRSTPGTPAELSAKRAAAGRKGGQAAQQAKQTVKQTPQQTEQVAQQATAIADSPVVASNEATPVPVTEPSVLPSDDPTTIPERAKWITDAYYARVPLSNYPAIRSIVIKALKAKLYPDQAIFDAVLRLATDNRGVTTDTLRYELDGPPKARRTASGLTPNNERNLALVQHFAQLETQSKEIS
jgi:hypothetical protein